MIEIGKATLADGRRIAEIQVTGWQAGYRGILPDSFLDRLNREVRVPVWERFIREELGVLLVARSDADVLGFCHLIPSRDADGDRIPEIAAIYVDPECWRSGCGRRLFAAAIASAVEQGFTGMTLWVLADNARGRGFYEAMGMRADGTVKSEERPDCTFHEVRYRIEWVRAGE
jgi:ribosomal protein S18 acetylase RimI-like enzyme